MNKFAAKFNGLLLLLAGVILLTLPPGCSPRGGANPPPVPPAPSPSIMAAPAPPIPAGAGWSELPERHYDDDQYIFTAKNRLIPRKIREIEDAPGGLQKEEEYIREMLQKDPRHRDYLYLLAYNQFDREKYESARKVFGEILRHYPGEERAVEGRAYCLYKMEDYRAARAEAEEALKKHPENPRLLHMLGGSLLYGHRDPARAAEIYGQAISLDGNDPRLWLGLAESYAEMKTPAGSRKAVEVMRETIRRFPRYHIVYILLAEELQLQGKYPEALRELGLAIERDPLYYRSYSIIGDIFQDVGRCGEAMEYYQKAKKTNPVYEALIYIKIGSLHRAMGNGKEAEGYYRQALDVHRGKEGVEENQEMAMAWTEMALLKIENGSLDKAKKCIDKAFRAYPQHEMNHYARGMWHLARGEHDKARKEVLACQNPESPENRLDEYLVSLGLARIYASRGKTGEALAQVEKALAQVQSFRKLAVIGAAGRDPLLSAVRGTGRFKEMQKELEPLQKEAAQLKAPAFAKDPPSPSPATAPRPGMPAKSPPRRYGEDEKIRSAKRKYVPREVWDVAGTPDQQKERHYLTLAAQREPGNPEPVFFLGFNYMEARMLPQAEEAFKKALSLDPGHALAAESLAMLYLQQEEYDKAAKAAARGLERHRDNPRLIRILGESHLYGREGRQKAESLFRSARKRGIKSPFILAGLAQAAPGKEEAESLLRECIRDYPAYGEAYLLLAEIKKDRGEYGEAESLLKAAAAQDPTLNEAYRALGEVCLEDGRFDEARQHFEKSLGLPYPPDDPDEVKLGLARASLGMGEAGEALKILREIIDGPGENSADARAWMAVALAAGGDAKAAGKELGGGDGSSPYRCYALGRVLAAGKSWSQAEEQMGKCLEGDTFPAFRIYLELAAIRKGAGDGPGAGKLIKEAMRAARADQKKSVRHLVEKDFLLKDLKGSGF